MKGYSLLELLVVICIVGTITVFAIPSLSFIWNSKQITTHINQLVRLLNYAKSLAMIEAKPVMVCPVSYTHHLCGVNWAEGINVYCIDRSKDILMKHQSSFNHAELIWNRDNNKIIFAANGLLQSQNGTFEYRLNKQDPTRYIILSSTGRIKTK